MARNSLIKVSVRGRTQQAKMIQHLGLVRARVGSVHGIEAVSRALITKILDHITHSDHSLADLRDLGHPYSRKRSRPLHGPFGVHVQRGPISRGPSSPPITALLSQSIEMEPISFAGTRVKTSIGPDTERAPHAIWIIDGTRGHSRGQGANAGMVPRDFLAGAATELKPKMLSIFNDGFLRGWSRS